MKRGTFEFETTAEGAISNTAGNVSALRRLWLDRRMINNEDLGPGDEGDFDNGAWHVACHIVAAGGVRKAADGRLMWIEISHDAGHDRYIPTLTADFNGTTRTLPLDATEARALLSGSQLLGFIEGNSTGHTSAGRVHDNRERFNGWQRQEFDRAVTDSGDGGKVWEHWCTVRDIREPDAIAASVLGSYVAICDVLDDRFAPTVARGRRSYGHPTQLCALVRSGFTSVSAATWDVTPTVIPAAQEGALSQAKPAQSLAAAKALDWGNPPRYYMFARRIAEWSPAAAVRRDLAAFPA